MHHAASALTAWYAAHARALPWRAPPGAPADPYRVWLSEIMLQQTTVAAVRPRFEAWTARWPTAAALAAAPEADILAAWAGLGYYARARNLAATARIVAATGFPTDEPGLRALPGVGDYTAAAIAAIAFGRGCLPVDTNIARVGARLLAADLPHPALRRALEPLFAPAPPAVAAQALMDLGATVCTPRAPACPRCPLRPGCVAAATGAPERWPAPKPRKPKPTRHGLAFWLEAAGHVLTVRRPPRGLLGGMVALPTSRWHPGLAPADALAEAPAPAAWTLAPTRVAHVFSHFRLELGIATARLPRAEPVAGADWLPRADLARAGLPTLFANVVTHAQAAARC